MVPQKRTSPRQATTGARLEQLRHEEGLSEEVFAARIGVKRQAYQFWKKGRNLPKGDNLKAIAREFRVTPGWILCLPGEPKHRGVASDLSEPVAEHVRRELMRIGKKHKWPPELLFWATTRRLDGEQFLRDGVQRAADSMLDALAQAQAIAESAEPVIEAAVYGEIAIGYEEDAEARAEARLTARMRRKNVQRIELERQLVRRLGFPGDADASILKASSELRGIAAAHAAKQRKALKRMPGR